MNIIIVGCGKVGSALAEQLADDGHDITVIDTNAEAVRRVTDSADVMGIVGNGAVHLVQQEAGIKYADLFIVMTNSDELNLLCCMIAKRSSDCKTIARVRNPVYINESSFIKEKLGISMIINPELVAASEMARLFSIPSAIEVDTFERGRIELLKTEVPEKSPIAGVQIKSALGKLSGRILICAVERGDKVIIPTGDDYIYAGDKISFITTHKDGMQFFKKAGIANEHLRSVIIVGGGKITVYLTQKLCEYGFKVKVIEKDKAQCEYLNSILPANVLIINGDGSDRRLLLEEGISEADGFASITDIDEENIMLSLYVGANFSAKTVTKINKLNFEGIIDRLPIGSVVYPKNITAELVLSYVRALTNSAGSSSIQTLYNIVGGKAQALEFKVKSESRVINKPLSQLNIRRNVLICCIGRDGKMIIPSGQDSIQVGDTVVVVTTDRELNDLSDILS